MVGHTVRDGSNFETNPMAVNPNRILKTIEQPAGKQRVLIVMRSDGLFSYEEERLVPVYDEEMVEQLNDNKAVWVPLSHGLTLCDSLEDAEREARTRIPWLANT